MASDGLPARASIAPWRTVITGAPNVGLVFFETAQLDAETVERARALPLIVAGSTWNEQVLREYGLDNVTTVIQGGASSVTALTGSTEEEQLH